MVCISHVFFDRKLRKPNFVVKLVEFRHAHLAIHKTRLLAFCCALGTEPQYASIAFVSCPTDSTIIVAAPLTFPKADRLSVRHAMIAQMSTAVNTIFFLQRFALLAEMGPTVHAIFDHSALVATKLSANITPFF